MVLVQQRGTGTKRPPRLDQGELGPFRHGGDGGGDGPRSLPPVVGIRVPSCPDRVAFVVLRLLRLLFAFAAITPLSMRVLRSLFSARHLLRSLARHLLRSLFSYGGDIFLRLSRRELRLFRASPFFGFQRSGRLSAGLAEQGHTCAIIRVTLQNPPSILRQTVPYRAENCCVVCDHVRVVRRCPYNVCRLLTDKNYARYMGC